MECGTNSPCVWEKCSLEKCLIVTSGEHLEEIESVLKIKDCTMVRVYQNDKRSVKAVYLFRC